jgi:hypothetical protein
VFLLRSAKGLHGDGWTDESAFLSVSCPQALQLWFSLPASVMLNYPKDVSITQDSEITHLSLSRGQSATTCIFHPKDGLVSLSISCGYPDFEGPPRSRRLGIQIAHIALIGEEPIRFQDFLEKSVAKTKSVIVSSPTGVLKRLNLVNSVDVRIDENLSGGKLMIPRGHLGDFNETAGWPASCLLV